MNEIISWTLRISETLGTAALAVLAADFVVGVFHWIEDAYLRENGPWINLLHDLRILQSSRHHAIHHTDPKSTHYCVITEFLNPVLERLRFWTRLECWLWKAFRIRRRSDTSNRRHGFTPEWVLLAEHA